MKALSISCTRLLGPAMRTSAGSAATSATSKPGAGPSEQPRADRHRLLQRALEVQGDDRGRDLHHAHAEGHTDVVGGQVDDVLALPHAAQVDAGPRRRRGSAAGSRWARRARARPPCSSGSPTSSRSRGHVLQLDGHGEARARTSSRPITNHSRAARARLTSLRGRLSSRSAHVLVLQRLGRLVAGGQALRRVVARAGPPARRGPRAAPTSASGRRGRGGCGPPTTSEIMPVSSETTTATASVSSVTPMAARWRLPSWRRQLRVHGEGQEAGGGGDAVALHDHRAVVQRRARVEDADEQVVGDVGVEADARLDVARAGPSRARARRWRPVRCAARVVAASTTSSTTSSVRCEPKAPSSGVLPRWASTFRISAWNTTMMPNTT